MAQALKEVLRLRGDPHDFLTKPVNQRELLARI
jgi:DNA-binding response OmpR family regulator